jgi:hypothetical protein
MRKLNRAVFIIISLLGLQKVQAQNVAGYMGKRFFVGIPVSYMPNIYGFVNEDTNIDFKGNSQFYMLNTPKIGGSIGYVVSNLRSIVVDVEFQNMGVNNNPDFEIINGQIVNEYLYGRSRLSSYKLRMQKAFQHCAPIGGYRGITLGLVNFNNSYIDKSGNEVDLGKTTDYSIGYAGGLRRVFKDKIIVDLSLEYNMHLKAISNLFDFEMDSKPSRELVAHYATNKNGLNNILVCRAAVYLLL